jgi:hypothetical protein
MELSREALGRYLERLFGGPARVVDLRPLGGGDPSKGYGYGVPVLVEFEAGGRRRRAVLETVAAGPYGHEHRADRAQSLIWAHEAYNRLPRHVRSLDVGAFRPGGDPVALGSTGEFFILTEFVEGRGYNEDLERLRAGGELTELDLLRADALCDYLAEIHRLPGPDPGLYVRRIRELVGHGECLMGIADGYPGSGGLVTADLLEAIEHRMVGWRWKLKRRTHRLSRVHGDFHPWNLLFREGTDFTVLDRSRGDWGEPADDLAALTINYLFFSLRRSGRLEGAFDVLFRRVWERYLARTGDGEALEVAAPFFAFRGLVVASPVWYPGLPVEVRRAVFNFITAVLDAPRFDPARVNVACGV